MNAILSISTLELLKLYSELIEAYHSINTYGGDEAEIYAYRLLPHSPFLNKDMTGPIALEEKSKLYKQAAHALHDLCYMFKKQYDCKIRIDNIHYDLWIKKIGNNFQHRVHVKILHK